MGALFTLVGQRQRCDPGDRSPLPDSSGELLRAHQIAALEQQFLREGSYSDQSITGDLPVYC